MLVGTHPEGRHDLRGWLPSDGGRSTLAGSGMSFRSLCLFVKCDWAEVVHSLGFYSWGHATSPCPMCFAAQESLYDFRGFSPLSFPHGRKTLHHYATDCHACEIHLTLDADDIRFLRPLLGFNRTRKVLGGRVLSVDVPRLGLQSGDILVPSVHSPDTFSFRPEDAPKRVTMWRTKNSAMVRFRNPLFSDNSGVTLDSLAVDWLHTLALGCFQVILSNLIWSLFDANAFEVPGGGTNRNHLSLLSMRGHLHRFYGDEMREGRQHTAVQNLSLSILGTAFAPTLNLHGAETCGVLRFADRVLLPQFGASLGSSRVHYTRAVTSMVCMLDIIRENEFVVPVPDIQRFCDSAIVHLRSLDALNIHCRFKHHGMLEMAAKLSRCATIHSSHTIRDI